MNFHYEIRRLGALFLTVWFVMLLTFSAFRVIPGNPALAILGIDASEAQVAELMRQLGADRPLAGQFLQWLKELARLDLGDSLRYSQPVAGLIAERIPVTVSLALLSLAFTIIVAVPLGIAAAKARGKAADLIISAGTQLGLAVPSFWSGIVLIILFGLTLQWFPVSKFVPWSENPVLALRSLLLPALAVAIPQIAIMVRYLRTALLEQLGQDYVRTAYSKGVKESRIYLRHVLKNALVPVVTVLGMNFGELLAGSLVIEQVFTLPGLGRLLITAIGSRDYPLVQGMVLLIAVVITGLNFLTDIAYRWLDPKIRLQ